MLVPACVRGASLLACLVLCQAEGGERRWSGNLTPSLDPESEIVSLVMDPCQEVVQEGTPLVDAFLLLPCAPTGNLSLWRLSPWNTSSGREERLIGHRRATECGEGGRWSVPVTDSLLRWLLGVPSLWGSPPCPRSPPWNAASQALEYVVRREGATAPGNTSSDRKDWQLVVRYAPPGTCLFANTTLCPSGHCSHVTHFCQFNIGCMHICGLRCDMESACPAWQWGPDLRNTTGRHVALLYGRPDEEVSGPITDAHSNPEGHFLYLRGGKRRVVNITSPWFNRSESGCHLRLTEHSFNVEETAIRVVGIKGNHEFVVGDHLGVNKNMWRNVTKNIGAMTSPFQLLLELEVTDKPHSHIAIDDILLLNCFPESPLKKECVVRDFQCSNQLCIDRSRVCDIQKDCPDAEDEHEDCDLVPAGSRCDFENAASPLCGWTNEENPHLNWIRQRGPSSHSMPNHDHTYQNNSARFVSCSTTTRMFTIVFQIFNLLLAINNVPTLLYEIVTDLVIWHYVLLKGFPSDTSTMTNQAKFNSPFFSPPPRYHGYVLSPYHNSCQFRFFYYANGLGVIHLTLYLQEEAPGNTTGRVLWESLRRTGHVWQRDAVTLPRLLHRYRLQFVGMYSRKRNFLAVDDMSFSPECFGIGVNMSAEGVMPPDETTLAPSQQHLYTRYHFSTCNAVGRNGPTQSACQTAYERTPTRVHVQEEGLLAGVQIWRVNETGLHSMVARGASGGQGASNNETSRGAVARGIFNWTAGDTIFVLVGQAGGEGCFSGKCSSELPMRGTGFKNALRGLETASGGGGGGATYVFKVDATNQTVLLLAAAGAGGLSLHPSAPDSLPVDGRADNRSAAPLNGLGPADGAGGGGSWDGAVTQGSGGRSLLQGGQGGMPCPTFKLGGVGGFGGGGGGCFGGGGGGGYAGGAVAVPDNATGSGEGGISYVSGLEAWAEGGAAPPGPGSVDIVAAFVGCGCQHLCLFLDLERQETSCVCPDDQQLNHDNVSCQALPSTILLPNKVLGLSVHHLVIIIICAFVVMTCIGTAMFFLYHRYRRQKMKTLRQELFGNAELQLNRLRQQTGGMVTEYNPNYEFGGSSCTVQDLKEVPRESLTLVKALGQGAFGEVYQGYLTNLAGDNEIPVAVKTLPELSASQAEMDFLMEALIMSKFNHPNIVSFIGVCFDKLPKFIVLELLPGGDLKSFLRESRPKPDRPSPLTMCDLLMLAMDVAKGCQYLEENHFIHRDIAARNCLLSTKGVGRVVKIADFGMARDIYRADYYRKGGKAMLPVKWMPPEAFLDGIFTSKTDVWSFGVLLWEVMSLGYMPYPGRGNQEVMQLVTSGGRLEPPSNCPGPVYHIMAQCWHSVPDERPNFVTILERIGYCLQDPDVIHASLPVFHRPPSTERDTTVMRPPETDSCLQVARPGDSEPLSPASTDYLIPIPALSNYSLSTERTDLHSPSSADSDAGLLDLDARSPDAPPVPTASEPAPILAPEPIPFSGQAALSRSCDSSPHTKKRAGGYTSVPTYDETPPPPPQFSSSVPESNIARQRPRSKPPGQSLMSLDRPGPLALAPQPNSLSALDVSALARQHPTTPAPPYPYANVDVNSVSPLVPKSVVNDKMDTYIIGNHFVERCNEKEINC